MNPLFQRLMNEAARLTRKGNLHAATEAIQRALRGGGAPLPQEGRVQTDADVIEADARVLEPVPAEADVRYVEPVEPEPATGQDAEPARWTDGAFAHGGRTLAYKLYLPPRAPGAGLHPMPLVLMLHGCTQNPADFAIGTRMNELARAQGFAVLYPAQTQHENAQGCWNWFKPQHQQRGRGEPALLAALTESVAAGHAIDRSRIYVAGLSAGGAMADILGHAYPDLFAAVGVHSGLPAGAASDLMSALGAMRSGPSKSAPASGKMPPLIVFHGDADATVNPLNGKALADRASGSSGSRPDVSQGVSPQGRRFTRAVYGAAAGRQDVEYWQLHGTAHAWSGGSGQGSYTDPGGVDASAEMLRFFLAHTL
ncbi:MAG: PHB depolymerase family esterase [Variovorax sp.]